MGLQLPSSLRRTSAESARRLIADLSGPLLTAAAVISATPAPVTAQSVIRSAVSPVEAWNDGNNFQGYLSGEALIAAKNAYSASQFALCMAQHAALGSQYFQCSRIEMSGMRPNPALNPLMINGKYTQYWAIATWIDEGRNGTQTTYASHDVSGLYVFNRSVQCPRFHPYTPFALVNEINRREIVCVNDKPAPAQCVGADPGRSAGTGAPGGVGNPIQIYGGVKTEVQTDYADPRGLLDVRRNFAGQGYGWRMPGSPALVDTISGNVSQQAFSEVLTQSTPQVPTGLPQLTTVGITFSYVKADPGGEVYLRNPDGSLARYVPAPSGDFSTGQSGDTLTRLNVATAEGAVWRVRRFSNVIEDFDADGKLRRRQHAAGPYVLYQYVNGNLAQTIDDRGRQVEMGSNASGSLTTLTLPDASVIRYGWADGELASVTYQDGTVRRYLYNEPDLAPQGLQPAPHSLTGAIDENGARIGTYKYSPAGVAISTESAEGVGRFVVADASGLYGAGYSQVTDPLGNRRITYFTEVNGTALALSRNQPAGSGCAASASQWSYDDKGNALSIDDFAGHRVCYAYDSSRNVETVRIEGLSTSASCSAMTPAGAVLPPGSRRISSRWHPDWRLASATAEPGRITFSVYNGQPDPSNGNALASCAPATAVLADGKPYAVLCRRIEQATTDTDGHLGFAAGLQSGVAPRVQGWTYNEFGQVLSATDALGNTTTYTYFADTAFSGPDPWAVGHTRGDLQTATNAVGKVTRYELYDKHGNLLQSTDPNGVVTRNTYDLRQRLLSTTVAGQTTAYTYDAAGQLLQVTVPDGSWVGYEYDPAHRLTAVKDNLGNRIEYTLDNAGNRIDEQSRDAGGLLHQRLRRSIDALGRTQLMTGRGE